MKKSDAKNVGLVAKSSFGAVCAQLCSVVLVCQAEGREENRDPTQSEGTYPVTSLVDWRQARWGEEDSGETVEKGVMCTDRP